jgi:hypothetical protein
MTAKPAYDFVGFATCNPKFHSFDSGLDSEDALAVAVSLPQYYDQDHAFDFDDGERRCRDNAGSLLFRQPVIHIACRVS